MVMWKLSKCIHIAGVAFVSLPEAKVSAASRKLKSSWTNGRGIGHRGRMASRSRNAAKPTTATDRLFLRASLQKVRSTWENQAEPSRGQQNATANAIAVRQPSISSSEGPCFGTEDKTIPELFASLALSVTAWSSN